MLYSEADRSETAAELHKRRLRVFLPTALILALAIASFVWFRLHRDAGGWIWTGLITVLGGAYCIFFYDVYLHPVIVYKRHLDYMLDGRKRETVGLLGAFDDDVKDQNGMDCISFTVNVGEKNDPEDDRLFYLDALKGKPELLPGSRVRILSNDRMVAGIELVPKES